MFMCKPPGRPCRVAFRAAPPAAIALVTVATLQAFAQGREQRPPAFTQGQVERGKSIYQRNCQDCHGSTLDNGEVGGAPLKGSYFRQHWGWGAGSGVFGLFYMFSPPSRPRHF